MNYYNDNDPKAAAWLRELIAANLIPPGDVDERSIEDVTKSDLEGYTQCHFFAGIGGWSEALRLAGWPADRPVWTGSCPCQPFSSAGKRQGTKDKRHLWPEFFRLIRECNPSVVFGEQVASPLGRKWLAGVRADLEALGYAVGAADLCAAGVGAPHIRQRLYWVADSNGGQCQQREGTQRDLLQRSTDDCAISGTGNTKHDGLSTVKQFSGTKEEGWMLQFEGSGDFDRGVVDTIGPQRKGRQSKTGNESQIETRGSGLSFWSDAIWINCADGKARRISPEPAFFPLVDGVPGRVAMLRGFGNAIVPQVAAEFIKAYEECDR